MKKLYYIFCATATAAFIALAAYSYSQVEPGYTQQERDELAALIDRETAPLAVRQAQAMAQLYGGAYD